MKKLAVLLAFMLPCVVNAQKIKRDQWSVQPKVEGTSFALTSILNNVENVVLETIAGVSEMDTDEYAHFWSNNSWYIPEFSYSYPIYSINSDNGTKIARPYWWRDIFLWGDYSHTFKFSAGYEFSWKSLISPWGAFIGVNWEYFQLALKQSPDAGKYRSQAIVPTVGLRFRLYGGSFEKRLKPALEIGGSYVYNFKYHNPNDYDIDAINNGFRGKVSLGIEIPSSHTAIMIGYERNFFDYFNKDFEDKNNSKPFADYKNVFGDVSLRVTHSF